MTDAHDEWVVQLQQEICQMPSELTLLYDKVALTFMFI